MTPNEYVELLKRAEDAFSDPERASCELHLSVCHECWAVVLGSEQINHLEWHDQQKDD